MNRAMEERDDESAVGVDDILAALGHDLKAPLRGLRAVLGFLREDFPHAGPEAAHRMRQLEDRVHTLERITGSLLGFAETTVRGATGWTSVALESSARRAAREAAPEGAVVLQYRGEPNTPPVPAAVVEHVVANLVRNAVLHHDRAPVRVWVGFEPKGDGFEILVEDDGPGMGRSHGSPPRTHGSGLGLALSQRLAQRCGGKLQIRSPIDGTRGTRVRFAIPAAPPVSKS